MVILREVTIKYKGYDPEDLKPKSNKKVCASCDNPNCKNPIRWIKMSAYRDICHKCKITKYTKNLNYFKYLNNNSCYWGGFIAADGYINNSNGNNQIEITLAKKDENHLIKFKTDCNFNGKINHKLIKNKYKASRLVINGVKEWIIDLEKHFNITTKKSLTLNPPNLYNNDEILSFIIGYIDGDGSIGVYKNYGTDQIHLGIAGTKSMLEFIKYNFDKLDPISNKSCSIRKLNNIYSYVITGKRANRILNKLIKINVPKMDRKWEIVKKYNGVI